MQQLTWGIGTWVALLVAGSGPPSGPQQTGSETEVQIRAVVDQQFALMSEAWRQDFSRRLAGLLDDPRVKAPTRAAILKECDRVIEGAAVPLLMIQSAADVFPAAAPPESVLEEGVRTCAVAIEGIVRNAALYAPLSEEDKAARRSDLKAIERQALRIVDERIVGDDRARGIVADRVAELFRHYETEVGNPIRPFLNRELPAGTLREILEDLEKSFPREKKYSVTGLTGDRDDDTQKLSEQGIDDLIDGVVVRKLYFSIHRASWADPAALKEVMTAEQRLWEWRARAREEILQKARLQKLEESRLRALLDPPSRVPRPIMKTAENPTSPDPSVRKGPQAAGNGSPPGAPAPSPWSGLRWPVIAVAAAVLVALLVLLRRKPA